jgi:hypothetical protein
MFPRHFKCKDEPLTTVFAASLVSVPILVVAFAPSLLRLLRPVRGLGRTDMFNVSTRFDRRWIWIYARLEEIAMSASMAGIARTSNCRRTGRAISFGLPRKPGNVHILP